MTTDQAAQITMLSCPSTGISDLTGIDSLTTLTYLGLGSNQVADISPLANLTTLTHLNLDGNQVTDLSPLANVLTASTSLTLTLYKQRVTLADITVGQTQSNIVVAPDGTSVQVTSTTAQIDPATNTWTLTSAGAHTLQWSTTVAGVTYSGTIVQTAIAAVDPSPSPSPTTPSDDNTTTPPPTTSTASPSPTTTPSDNTTTGTLAVTGVTIGSAAALAALLITLGVLLIRRRHAHTN